MILYMKSISPIIASILIIVITVAIFGIFYTFTSGIFNSITSSSNNLVNQQSKVISFQISNVYCSNNKLYLIIYNNGNVPIDINKAITIISDNQNTYNTTIICNNTTIIQPRQQITCNLNNIICYYNPLSNSKYRVSLIVGGVKDEKYLGTGYEAQLYRYLRNVIIDNSLNSNSLTDYQILITLDTQSLISQGKMRSDCGDIRFTDFNGTLLNYWIEPNTCNTSNTLIWVKVPFIPGSSSKTIYLWYGNPSATSMSNGDLVFDFFDDFEGTSLNTSKWNILGDGSLVIDNGIVHTTGAKAIYGKINISGIFDKYLEVKAKFRGSQDNDVEVGFGYITSSSLWQGDRAGESITAMGWDNKGIVIIPAP